MNKYVPVLAIVTIIVLYVAWFAVNPTFYVGVNTQFLAGEGLGYFCIALVGWWIIAKIVNEDWLSRENKTTK